MARTTPKIDIPDQDDEFNPYLYLGREEDAAYHFLDIPGHDGNPLPEALGPFLSREEVARRLTYLPDVRPSDRLRPIRDRYELIWEATDFYKPMSQVIQLEEKFSRLARAGYKWRNPFDPWHQRRVHGRVDSLAAGHVSDLNGAGGVLHTTQSGEPFGRGPHRRSRPLVTGLTVLGLGGVGKSSAFWEILNLYPQVIRHTRYPGPAYRGRWDGPAEGRPFTQTQIVWLYLPCPHNRSTNTLCRYFFATVDAILGTNYSKIFRQGRGLNRSTLILEMARVALNHHLGALVMDEVQVLSVAKSRGHQEMLDFFTELRNMIGIPVILIGTPRAAPILTAELHGARRGEALGSFKWLNMREDAEWREFITALWTYQYIQNPSDLTDSLSHALYHESAGITDYAIKLFFLAQIRAIEVAAATGKAEKLSPALITSVAKDSIPLGRPALAQLRRVTPSTSFKTLAGIPEIEQIEHEAVIEAAIERSNKIETLNGGHERPVMEVNAHVPAESPGLPKTPPVDDTGYNGADNPSSVTPVRGHRGRRMTDTQVAGNDSIMAIVAAAQSRKVTPYEALLSAGLICQLENEIIPHAIPATEAVR